MAGPQIQRPVATGYSEIGARTTAGTLQSASSNPYECGIGGGVLYRGGGGGGAVSSVAVVGGNNDRGNGQQQESRSGVSSNDALIVSGSQVEILVDTASKKCNKTKDVEQGSKRVRHKNRPLFRRFFTYVRNAFSGVNFSSSHDSELEELEAPPRYRPDSLSALCRATRFSEAEIKRIYRGFKAECPTGVVREDTFKIIYAQFFPQGANTGLYAHYVFNTLDQDHSGIISFEDFVQGLSILSRGSMEEKLRWTFSLYDINGDGYITREEMTDIVTAIYELVGRLPDTCPDEEKIKEKVERIFQKMDINRDGVVTLDEFLMCCRNDEAISRSIAVFDTAF
ncbi:unnamed protein product [Hermetia illucens]|uniref:EF-hand domain-containing protein n=1 Tax=Hermetia illucens TaxID=343691 RepID=A0A7R8V3X4_HERIL|nr:Kv channel-interacting protein 4 isoform X2 [Hermetia illucens]CAD7091672.1 unnamed protein product [Hermetia illucens]